MSDKKQNPIMKKIQLNRLDEGAITHCPTCGVDLKGSKPCASITCPCAPRITI